MAKTEPATGPNAGTAAAPGSAAAREREGALIKGERGPSIKVRATAVGFYGDVRRRVGDVFVLYPRRGTFSQAVNDKDGERKLTKGTLLEHPVTEEVNKVLTAEEQFSPKWMEKVSADTPERASSAREVIKQEHDTILQQRLAGSGPATAPRASTSTGDTEVLD